MSSRISHPLRRMCSHTQDDPQPRLSRRPSRLLCHLPGRAPGSLSIGLKPPSEGSSSSLLGVTKGEPSERRLQSLLLTPEGFILFDAELSEGGIAVRKAVAPFDSPAFARGLMEDVTLLFLSPQVEPATWGKETDGTMICNWEDRDESHTEITGSMDSGWRILRRNKQGEVIKEVVLNGPFINGLASRMELRAFKPAPYRLRMTLLQAFP